MPFLSSQQLDNDKHVECFDMIGNNFSYGHTTITESIFKIVKYKTQQEILSV